MAQERALEDRLAALERRLDPETGTDTSTTARSRAQSHPDDADGTIEDRIADLEATVAELDGAVQALRGYVGNVNHVNQEVERRANAAIAAVERLESAPKTPPPIASAERTADTAIDPDVDGDAPTTDGSGIPDESAGGLFDRLARSI